MVIEFINTKDNFQDFLKNSEKSNNQFTHPLGWDILDIYVLTLMFFNLIYSKILYFNILYKKYYTYIYVYIYNGYFYLRVHA